MSVIVKGINLPASCYDCNFFVEGYCTATFYDVFLSEAKNGRQDFCPLAPAPRWIPVTERLPEHEYGESTSVLTVDLYGVMRVTYFDGGNWCWPTGEALTTMRVAPITHWMPLPEPPEEET